MDTITNALQAAEHRLKELRPHYDGLMGGRIDVELQLLADALANLKATTTEGRFDRVRRLPDGSFEHSYRGQPVAGPVADTMGSAWTVTQEVNQQLATALKDMIELAERMMKDAGGCDHSVGVCRLDDQRVVDTARELLRITGVA